MKKSVIFLYILLGVSLGGIAQVKPLPFSNYIALRAGLPNISNSIYFRKQATVAFLGGSITFNDGWRNKVCTYLTERFPQTKFHFIAAGIPSLGSLPHAFRLKRDLLDSGKIDLLFLEAAVNDQVNGTDSTTQVLALEGIVRHAKNTNPLMDIVMMSFADPDKTKLYDLGKVPVSVANHELVAAHYRLPSINLAKAVADKMNNHEFNWDKDFKDLHPSPFGQELYFSAIKDLLDKAIKPAQPVKISKPLKFPKSLNNANFTDGDYYPIERAIYDSDWVLNKDWAPSDQLGTRPGFVHVPVLEATKPGASLTLKFSGNAIGMAIVSGSDAGIVTYTIDGGPEKQINLYTEWSNSLHLPWYVLFGSGLKNGTHILRLTISQDKDNRSRGNSCRIVNFLVNR